MILHDQTPAYLEPCVVDHLIFLVEIPQAAQERPQHFGRFERARRVDHVGQAFHVRFPAVVLQYEHSAWRLARSSGPPLLCGRM